MDDLKRKAFVATIEGYKALYQYNGGKKVVHAIDYVVDADNLAVHSLTDSGVLFMKFIAERFATAEPKIETKVI